MSALKPLELAQFYRLLHLRKQSSATLADKLNVSPAVVRKLIGLLKRRRGLVWERLLGLLTDEEKRLLLTVEQCSAWNISQTKKRPVWTPEKVAGLAETYTGKFDAERDRLRKISAS
jgi:hypothetical protein